MKSDHERRRDRTEAQLPAAAPQTQIDPLRALPGHCQICGEYVGSRGRMWTHPAAMHPSFPMQEGVEPPKPEYLGPPGGRTPPGHCPKCGEKVEPPQMLRRHTRLCNQADFYGRPR
jgi:hypothetical protein